MSETLTSTVERRELLVRQAAMRALAGLVMTGTDYANPHFSVRRAFEVGEAFADEVERRKEANERKQP